MRRRRQARVTEDFLWRALVRRHPAPLGILVSSQIRPRTGRARCQGKAISSGTQVPRLGIGRALASLLSRRILNTDAHLPARPIAGTAFAPRAGGTILELSSYAWRPRMRHAVRWYETAQHLRIQRIAALVAVALIGSATWAAAAPSAVLTITETSRTASATGRSVLRPQRVVHGLLRPRHRRPGELRQLHLRRAGQPLLRGAGRGGPSRRLCASTHPTDRIRITLGWDPQASDLDMHVYLPPYDTSTGSPFRSSRNNPPTPEVVEFPAPSGRTSYRVFVVPSAPAAISATVTASLVTGPTPTQSGTVILGGPTFASYTPPAGVTTRANSVSEPTMGVEHGHQQGLHALHPGRARSGLRRRHHAGHRLLAQPRHGRRARRRRIPS